MANHLIPFRGLRTTAGCSLFRLKVTYLACHSEPAGASRASRSACPRSKPRESAVPSFGPRPDSNSRLDSWRCHPASCGQSTGRTKKGGRDENPRRKPSSRPVACLLSGAHPSLGRAGVSYVLYALYAKNWYLFCAGLSARLGGVYGFHRRHTGNLDLVSNMVDHLVGMAGKRNRRPIGFGEGILP